jgi:K+-transporting ATPase KdpF subunit
MSWINIAGLLAAIGLLIYLVLALIYAEEL